jgi:hypothetical protein
MSVKKEWVDSIARNGVCRPSLRSLLAAFGFEKRGASNLSYIQSVLSESGIVINDFEDVSNTKETGLDDNVELSESCFRKDKSILVSSEDDLKSDERIIEIRRGLGMESKSWSVMRHTSSQWHGTRRSMDLFAERRLRGVGSVVEVVAIELKKDGGEGGFEQLLCYMYHLVAQDRYCNAKVRGVLISGLELISSHASLLVFGGFNIDWYLYKVKENALVLEKQKPDSFVKKLVCERLKK